MPPTIAIGATSSSERGGMMLEAVLGAALIGASLALFFQHYQAQLHFRAHAAAGRDVRALIDHIKARAAAGGLQAIAPGESVHLSAEDLEEMGLVAPHMARSTISAILERGEEGGASDLHLFLHGRPNHGEMARRTLQSAAGHREWFSQNKPLPPSVKVHISAILSTVSHGFHAELPEIPPIVLPAKSPDKLDRAWDLDGPPAWWLDPAYMPVTVDIAEKLRDGWEITPQEGGTEIEETLPDCDVGAGEQPLIIAAPESAFTRIEIDADASPVILHAPGEEHIFGHYYLGPNSLADGPPHSRELRVTALKQQKAWPISVTRAGGADYPPDKEMLGASGLWHGWAVDGILHFARNPDIAPPGHWAAAAHDGGLFTANRDFKLVWSVGAGSSEHRVTLNMHESQTGRLTFRPGLHSSFNPVWYRVMAEETHTQRAAWAPSLHDWPNRLDENHLTVTMAVAESELLAARAAFLARGEILPSFRFNVHDERVYYHALRGGTDGRRLVFQALYDRLRDHALMSNLWPDRGVDLPADAATLLLPGEEIHDADANGRVRIPAPAHQIPQSFNFNELLMVCDHLGVCVPLENEAGDKGIHPIARNDPAAERNARPDGDLHFGKVNIFHPPESVRLIRACL